jgi:hypothetical protein
MSNYQEKYLKYKQKYLHLVGMEGGGGMIHEKFKEKFNKYEFDIDECNNIYWTELENFLTKIIPEDEEYNRISEKKIDKEKIECSYKRILDCERDNYFLKENTIQIILGRYFDTIGCFYKCTKNYFVMAMTPYSLFKNDVFIRYILDKHILFINNNIQYELEDVFPIRILISEKHIIPMHKFSKIQNIIEYFSQKEEIIPVDYTFAGYIENYDKYIDSSNILQRQITSNIPISHIISREMCILYNMNMYFYIIQIDGNNYEPFILCSKYDLEKIKSIYKEQNKKIPNILLLYKK